MIIDNTERNLQLLQLYKDGHSYAEIAKMYGFSRSWVGAIIRKAGGEKHVRQYKTSDRHRELCNKRYREKKPPKPPRIDPELLWKLGHEQEAKLLCQ